MYSMIYLDEVKLFDAKEKAAGTLHFTARYDKSQLYKGEKVGLFKDLPKK